MLKAGKFQRLVLAYVNTGKYNLPDGGIDYKTIATVLGRSVQEVEEAHFTAKWIEGKRREEEISFAVRSFVNSQPSQSMTA